MVLGNNTFRGAQHGRSKEMMQRIQRGYFFPVLSLHSFVKFPPNLGGGVVYIYTPGGQAPFASRFVTDQTLTDLTDFLRGFSRRVPRKYIHT